MNSLEEAVRTLLKELDKFSMSCEKTIAELGLIAEMLGVGPSYAEVKTRIDALLETEAKYKGLG